MPRKALDSYAGWLGPFTARQTTASIHDDSPEMRQIWNGVQYQVIRKCFLIRDGAGPKWLPPHKTQEKPHSNHSRLIQRTSRQIAFIILLRELYTSKCLLMLLKVMKIEHENFYLLLLRLLILFFFLFFHLFFFLFFFLFAGLPQLIL